MWCSTRSVRVLPISRRLRPPLPPNGELIWVRYGGAFHFRVSGITYSITYSALIAVACPRVHTLSFQYSHACSSPNSYSLIASSALRLSPARSLGHSQLAFASSDGRSCWGACPGGGMDRTHSNASVLVRVSWRSVSVRIALGVVGEPPHCTATHRRVQLCISLPLALIDFPPNGPSHLTRCRRWCVRLATTRSGKSLTASRSPHGRLWRASPLSGTHFIHFPAFPVASSLSILTFLFLSSLPLSLTLLHSGRSFAAFLTFAFICLLLSCQQT